MIVLKILLTILKILGFIIAGILALVILVILSVLLCPIRYKGYVKYKDEPVVLVKANWLYHIISVKFALKGKKSRFQINLFGHKVGQTKKKKSHKKKDSLVTFQSDAGKDIIPDTKEDIRKEPDVLHNTQQDAHDIKFEKKSGKKFKEKKSKAVNKIKEFKENFSYYAQKREELLTEINDESNKRAVGFVWSIVKKLIKHSMPHSHHISVLYGAGDPAQTGERLGIMYAVCALIGLNLVVTPDFDNKVFECETHFKGKIILLYVAVLALKAYKNKDLKQLINKIKER